MLPNAQEMATAHDLAAMSAELEHLVREERQLSAMRRRLHEQIDNGFPNDVIVRREREVSDERRALHRRIDTIRLYVSGQLDPAV